MLDGASRREELMLMANVAKRTCRLLFGLKAQELNDIRHLYLKDSKDNKNCQDQKGWQRNFFATLLPISAKI